MATAGSFVQIGLNAEDLNGASAGGRSWERTLAQDITVEVCSDHYPELDTYGNTTPEWLAIVDATNAFNDIVGSDVVLTPTNLDQGGVAILHRDAAARLAALRDGVIVLDYESTLSANGIGARYCNIWDNTHMVGYKLYNKAECEIDTTGAVPVPNKLPVSAGILKLGLQHPGTSILIHELGHIIGQSHNEDGANLKNVRRFTTYGTMAAYTKGGAVFDYAHFQNKYDDDPNDIADLQTPEYYVLSNFAYFKNGDLKQKSAANANPQHLFYDVATDTYRECGNSTDLPVFRFHVASLSDPITPPTLPLVDIQANYSTDLGINWTDISSPLLHSISHTGLVERQYRYELELTSTDIPQPAAGITENLWFQYEWAPDNFTERDLTNNEVTLKGLWLHHDNTTCP